MIIPITLFFGAIGYLCYKSKDELSLIENELEISIEQKEDDDLYDNLEDLFI